jgi:hypothetical protein
MKVIELGNIGVVPVNQIVYVTINPDKKTQVQIWLAGGQTIFNNYDTEKGAKDLFDYLVKELTKE